MILNNKGMMMMMDMEWMKKVLMAMMIILMSVVFNKNQMNLGE